MVEFSIILPTYNRADVIRRAIDSVVGQTFTDWELIVVDDGSTDDTATIVRSYPASVRYLGQPNGGCYVARNTGLRAATGRRIAFLDADDEWLAHHLELAAAFFEANDGAQFLMVEFWDDRGHGKRVRNDHDLVANQWPQMAAAVGSSALDLPAGQVDDYMRVFETRTPLGPWGAAIAARAKVAQPMHYTGRIFRAFRWGHLGWLPATVITRTALEAVGPFKDNVRTAGDYNFLAALSRRFTAHMLSVPGAIKHATGPSDRKLAEDHLATGRNEYLYATTRLRLLDEVFSDPAEQDEELARIRGLFHFYAGKVALRSGDRGNALEHLRQSRQALPDSRPILWHQRFAGLVPSSLLCGALYRGWRRLSS